MGGRRREDVAAVERRRHGLECVLTVRDLVGSLDPAELLRGRYEQPVVRADVQAPVHVAERDLPPTAADAGVDDRKVDALRQVGERVREHERALEDPLRLDAVRDVDDLGLRRDPLHHAVAGPDEIVLKPEVGQERDQHVSPTLTNPPPRGGRPGRGSSLPRRREAFGAGCLRGLGTDRNDWDVGSDSRERPGRGTGGKDHHVPLGRLTRPDQARPVERDEVCAELLDGPSARSLGRGEEDAALARRKLGQKPVLRRDARHERGLDAELPKRLRGPRPDRSHASEAGRRRARSAHGRRSGSSRSPSRSLRPRPGRREARSRSAGTRRFRGPAPRDGARAGRPDRVAA